MEIVPTNSSKENKEGENEKNYHFFGRKRNWPFPPQPRYFKFGKDEKTTEIYLYYCDNKNMEDCELKGTGTFIFFPEDKYSEILLTDVEDVIEKSGILIGTKGHTILTLKIKAYKKIGQYKYKKIERTIEIPISNGGENGTNLTLPEFVAEYFHRHTPIHDKLADEKNILFGSEQETPVTLENILKERSKQGDRQAGGNKTKRLKRIKKSRKKRRKKSVRKSIKKSIIKLKKKSSRKRRKKERRKRKEKTRKNHRRNLKRKSHKNIKKHKK